MFHEGLTTKEITICITRDEVRQYCQAILEDHPMYHDIKAAKQANYSDIPLPATYPSLFWQALDIPWFAGITGMIQTNQTFTYNEPLLANTTYSCYIVLEKVRTFGRQHFLHHTLYVERMDQVAATSETTLMVNM